MKTTDVLVDEFIDANPGATRSLISKGTGVDEKEVGRALNRLKQRGMVASDDASGCVGRRQRGWHPLNVGAEQFARIVVPVEAAPRVQRAQPFSVFTSLLVEA